MMRSLGKSGVDSPTTPLRSLYVHAPFCAGRCFYCDFAVTVPDRVAVDEWSKALAAELRMVEEEGQFLPEGELDTVFVGGGTPSLLGTTAMAELVGILGPDRFKAAELEWTAEANPESFTKGVAAAWADAGVNRVSLGVQSFQPEALSWLNRLHGAEESGAAVARAREVGINNLNLDLIFGLPPNVGRDWPRDLELALASDVPHLSLYGLSVEKGTPLSTAITGGEIPPPDEEDFRDQFLRASERLLKEGYRQYEVSNFARPGFESRHNQAYWTRAPFLGLGNSAHSFRGDRRRWNLRHWDAYQRACAGGRRPWEEEVLTPGDIRLEEIWLGLRTRSGVRLQGLRSGALKAVARWVSEGQATVTEGVVRLTPPGWLVLDDLAVELDLAQGMG